MESQCYHPGVGVGEGIDGGEEDVVVGGVVPRVAVEFEFEDLGKGVGDVSGEGEGG